MSSQPSSIINLDHGKWRSKLEKILIVNLGFKDKRSNPFLYLICESNATTIIASHVDDLLLASSDFEAMTLAPASINAPYFSSDKIEWNKTSVMRAEILAFSDSFDCAHVIAHDC